jgi:hypothetical protein
VVAADVDYDVTQPQPQLFVTPSFEALHDVLDHVVRGLPSAQGGEVALAEAELSREIATIELSGGASLFGVLSRRLLSDGASLVLEVAEPARAELDGRHVDAPQVLAVLGDAKRGIAALAPGSFELALAQGVRLAGNLRSHRASADGSAALLVLESGRLSAGSELDVALGPGAVVVLAQGALGAHAGAPSDFFPTTQLPQTLVPKAHTIPPLESKLLGLYESALSVLRSSHAAEIVPVFERIHRELGASFEHDWLLRWNLLESLQKVGQVNTPLADELRRELELLEIHYHYRQPIASGLGYLSRAVLKAAASP